MGMIVSTKKNKDVIEVLKKYDLSKIIQHIQSNDGVTSHRIVQESSLSKQTIPPC